MTTSIKQIEVRNFRTFKHMIVDIDRFNVLIGANNSGKTNFIQILRFVRDIATSGLENAISMQGGVEYLQNIMIGSKKNLFLKLTFETAYKVLVKTLEEFTIGLRIFEVFYEFELKFIKNRIGATIEHEQLVWHCEFVKLQEDENGEYVPIESFGNGNIIISHKNNQVNVSIHPPNGTDVTVDDIYPPFLEKAQLDMDTLLLQTVYSAIPDITWNDALEDITLYDIYPRTAKESSPITGKAELESDGSNLSITLKRIIENPEDQRKLTNLIQNVLPFITKFEVEKYADRSMLFKLQETYSNGQYIPASFVSEGTINLIALVIALYFEEKPIIAIEEPERNIHPSLIAKVVEMLKDASQYKQIFVTTHNPEVLKYSNLENVLLITRGEEGFSVVSRPADSKDLKIFLENEIGIDELFIQNLIG